MTQRLKERKMDDNYAGEGFIQGGIFIFDNEGKVRYAYEEEIGKEIEMENEGSVECILQNKVTIEDKSSLLERMRSDQMNA
eukprot:scaffold13337_cov203-Alexandrium_tamarense.AAC.15